MSTTRRRPKPPESLGDAGKAFWASVIRLYDLAPAEVVMLGRACRTVDLLATIDAALIDDGPVVEGSVGQVRAHPLLRAKFEQEQALDLLVRSLALPFPDEDAGQRRSPQQVAAAQARWRSQRGAAGG